VTNCAIKADSKHYIERKQDKIKENQLLINFEIFLNIFYNYNLNFVS